MGSRTAISAGVLAVALAAVPSGAPAASAAAQDCTREGGLLSGVTNTLCDVVSVVTGTVSTLGKGKTDRVTEEVDKTTDEVLSRVGETAPTGEPSTRSTTQPSPNPTSMGITGETYEDVCPPTAPCEARTEVESLTPEPTSPAERKNRSKGRGEEESPAVATQAPTPPDRRPQQLDTERPVVEKKVADVEEPRVDLLWPNPFAHELTVPMQDQRVVRPTPPASDVLGTLLTIALLGSAVLATRIVQQRRHRAEPEESIPFEPGRVSNGRHRVA
ncbi:hypothetical protein ACFOY2_24490 [Nonomuraea purpurea]|uniref:Secreted protein n=1 Tax=Nonomuraea purpurea TaxID=1849276 RepID=A0ABV8GDJ9_9ACTN